MWPGAQVRRWCAQANGTAYRVMVWCPEGEPPPDGFPAVYVLDANALFGTFVEAVRRSSRRTDATGIGPTAVIGIAHDSADLFANAQRQRDYTVGPPAHGAAPTAEQMGGAMDFLSFIADELILQLRRELPLSAARQTLFGHSLAGQFVLQALASRPQVFAHWAAISPSVWWDEAGLRAKLAALAAARCGQPGSAPRLFLAVGEWEEAVPPWQRQQPGYAQLVARRAQRRMVGSVRDLAALLTAHWGAERVRFHVFADEDHASILMVAVQRVLRFMWGDAG